MNLWVRHPDLGCGDRSATVQVACADILSQRLPGLPLHPD